MRIALLLAALSLTACVDAGVGDDVATDEQALGDGCGVTVSCPYSWNGAPDIAGFSYNTGTVKGALWFGVMSHASSGDHYNLSVGIYGEQHLVERQSFTANFIAGTSVLNAVQGAMYDAGGQFCATPSSCSPWTDDVTLYIPGKGTHWMNPVLNPYNVPWAGGYEPAGTYSNPLGVCVAWLNGVQVGKYHGTTCNIEYGGKEVVLDAAQVISYVDTGVGWTWTTGSNVPSGAIPAGREYGGPQYICRAYHNGGYHPGKLIWDGCHYGYGGQGFVETGWYQVLTD